MAFTTPTTIALGRFNVRTYEGKECNMVSCSAACQQKYGTNYEGSIVVPRNPACLKHYIARKTKNSESVLRESASDENVVRNLCGPSTTTVEDGHIRMRFVNQPLVTIGTAPTRRSATASPVLDFIEVLPSESPKKQVFMPRSHKKFVKQGTSAGFKCFRKPQIMKQQNQRQKR